LDDQRRWSLSYLGAGQPVPLIRNAILGAWIGDQLVTLSDLEYTSAGTERPAGGEALRIRGTAAGVSLEASFFTSIGAAPSVATVALSVYPDRVLPALKGVRFFQTTASDLLPGTDPLVALIEARQASDAPRLAGLPLDPATPSMESHGALGLVRGARGGGLGLAFDASDPGAGVVRIAGENIEAVSEWMPGRVLRPAGDTSQLQLSYDPDGDGLTALRALLAPSSPADLARMLAMPAPAGWSTRGLAPGNLTEADVIANAEICAVRFDRRFCRWITVGDGYQRAPGDWDTNERFPHGHRWLTEQLHSRGLLASLRVAPLAVAQPTREALVALARRAVREWGYDALELDFVGADVGSPESFRAALAALREGAGPDTPLRGVGAPLQHAVGFLNTMRVTPTPARDASGIEPAARALALRSFYHRGAWLNDAGPLTLGPPLERGEAQRWASIVAVLGTVVEYADDFRTLPDDRAEMVARTLPVALPGGRPVAAMAEQGATPRVWITEGAPRWWTIVLANWAGAAAEFAVPLADLGIGAGTRCDAYDVWSNLPLAPVADALRTSVPPRSSMTIALRATSARPQVIGTTRHTVQGAIDVTDETWDAATRTLRCRATNLDSRAYGITIAIPPDAKPAACTARTGGASVACVMRQLESGHVVVEWAEGAASGDVEWAMTFEGPPAPAPKPRRKPTRP
jgi:hypothetical protein